ncbi:MAG TPA: alpha/beta fold hydrolase [Stellaceae bacterium]|nr:alpha/beta fold hydrolase [Stellaceae bacterium]
MSSSSDRPTRRALVKAAGLGVAAGLLRPAVARAQDATVGSPEVWSAEYTAKKGEVSLAMYRKRAAAPKSGEAPLPVLLLVHGSSVSAQPSYDLTVPGHGDYSVLNAFAKLGYDVWTVDHENYGRSSRTDGKSDIASGVEDLKSAVELIVGETGRQKVHMFGESSGGLRAGAYAMVRPDRVDRLVLSAFTYKGEGSPTLAKRAEQVEYFKTHSRRKRDRAMIESIFTRDKPGTSDPAMVEALVTAELKYGEEVPTGTYLDMTAHLPVVDPAKVLGPVMLIRGEYDGIATVDDLVDFYKQLPNGDRQFVILPGTAHSVVWGLNHREFFHAMHAFLTMPPPVSA